MLAKQNLCFNKNVVFKSPVTSATVIIRSNAVTWLLIHCDR